MNQEDILLEYRRGDESSAAAQLLATAGLCNDAMSRAYYAVLHYVRCLLLLEEIVPQSHHGAFVHFARLFVKSGIMSADFNRILGRLQKLREEADYMSGASFAPDDLAYILEDVRAFHARVTQILEERGIISVVTGSDHSAGVT